MAKGSIVPLLICALAALGNAFGVTDPTRPTDPAAYFGHREADLAMTHLFGGFEPLFYRAYEDEWPLAAGHGERLPVYQLYHLLNHLNLFGSGYYASCERILERFSK